MKFQKFLRTAFLVLVILLAFSCEKKKYSRIQLSYTISNKQKPLEKDNLKNWHFKDVIIDTISGISLNRAYDSLLIHKRGKEVVVAIIDMAVDVTHKELENHIWVNIDEIPNNTKDDDDNGYIDDVNGWNFLNNKTGENNEFVNYEYTRILKKYNSKFQNKTINEVRSEDSLLFVKYKRALEAHTNRLKYAKEDSTYITNVSKWKSEAEHTVEKFITIEKQTLERLDSLKNIYPKNDKLQTAIHRKSNFIKYGFTDDYIEDYKLKAESRISKLLNTNFDDRKVQGDDSEDINDLEYGTPNFNVNTSLLDHGTKIAGIITNIGLNKEIKIIPLAISAYGDEHDKDISLAIRYAVNNGAKVINMSFYKTFILNKKWVDDAIRYAEKNNVLIINCAGNDDFNLNENQNYPTDQDHNSSVEISDNFLKIGASGVYLDEKLKYSSSNYGKKEVDLFAPGYKVYTTYPNNENGYMGGTSSGAAITSGVAALIYSYYPNLTASQIKHILMDSGLEYTFEVSTPTKEDKNKTTPFNQLSKSGKVLNAYNALIMADSISRN
ncbi:S8 family serine peptidase [Tenacibaculum tangerinum]|uniref:S8 family serine peptidase n=1 Tax=Tenacibaculum tangerinum TaxID=3038772 RepID=A0ABY8L3D2_9FLAO|nr:S8 family serine peptidase [Tenacibaculum tangerinum]WGH74713.1 S8 family serine peptidase [Tenacibaculum tangerinum]